MDRRVPATAVREYPQSTLWEKKSRAHGLRSEEDMLDWLENQQRLSAGGPRPPRHGCRNELSTPAERAPSRSWRLQPGSSAARFSRA
jgi:hypothetical protein